MSDKILYRGKLFQVIKRSKESRFLTEDAAGKSHEVKKELTFELVRRPPGVRAIIVKDGKLLLNKEYRYELEDWDYRLPGGKVFDSAEEFEKAMEEENAGREYVRRAAQDKLAEEILEEADIKVEDFRLFGISGCGLTVEWDLYYFVVDKFEIMPSFYGRDMQKSEYEYISHIWVGFDMLEELIFKGKIREDRSIAMIFKYMAKQRCKAIEPDY